MHKLHSVIGRKIQRRRNDLTNCVSIMNGYTRLFNLGSVSLILTITVTIKQEDRFEVSMNLTMYGTKFKHPTRRLLNFT